MPHRDGASGLCGVLHAPLAPETVPNSDAEYDFPMFKAFASARQYAATLGREKELRQQSADPSLPKRSPSLEAFPAPERAETGQRIGTVARRSSSIAGASATGPGRDDPGGFDGRHPRRARHRATGRIPGTADLEARAWAEFGNAHRVADDEVTAEADLAHALARSSQGTGDPCSLRG